MAKKKSSASSENGSENGDTSTRIRRPREYRFEFKVGDEPYESAGLVLTSRNDAKTVKDFLNSMESVQEAGMTYRITEQIILS